MLWKMRQLTLACITKIEAGGLKGWCYKNWGNWLQYVLQKLGLFAPVCVTKIEVICFSMCMCYKNWNRWSQSVLLQKMRQLALACIIKKLNQVVSKGNVTKNEAIGFSMCYRNWGSWSQSVLLQKMRQLALACIIKICFSMCYKNWGN